MPNVWPTLTKKAEKCLYGYASWPARPTPPRQFWQTDSLDWRGPNLSRPKHPLEFGARMFVRVHYSTRRGRCLYVSTFGISCDSSSFLLTSGTSDVCTGRLRADVCTGQPFRVSPSGAAQTSKRRNQYFRAISVALRGGAARCFPPPDVCAAPLCATLGPKKASRYKHFLKTGFKCLYG